MKAFPSDFLWGASSSAFQIEGAYLEDGKSLTIMDMETRSGIADTKIAIDHYHHWKEDIALMKECGLTSYRFSISWSRILPQGRGTVNSKGDVYKRQDYTQEELAKRIGKSREHVANMLRLLKLPKACLLYTSRCV